MMKIKPHEILKYLGLDVPEAGIEINPHDTLLHVSLLRLLGRQMNVSAIAESELADLHVGLHGAHNGPGAVLPDPTSESVEKLRALLCTIQKKTLGMNIE